MWPSQLYNSELYREVCKTGVRALGKIPESMVYFTHMSSLTWRWNRRNGKNLSQIHGCSQTWAVSRGGGTGGMGRSFPLSPKGWDVELLGWINGRVFINAGATGKKSSSGGGTGHPRYCSLQFQPLQDFSTSSNVRHSEEPHWCQESSSLLET